MIWKKKIFSKCFFDYFEKLLPWSILLKNQVKMTKQEVKTLLKNVKMTSINYVKHQKWDMVWIIIFPIWVSDPDKQLHLWQKFHKENVKKLTMTKECQNVVFFCIYYIKHSYKGHFSKNMVNYPPQLHFTWTRQGFSEPPDPSVDY